MKNKGKTLRIEAEIKQKFPLSMVKIAGWEKMELSNKTIQCVNNSFYSTVFFYNDNSDTIQSNLKL